ncbi:MAG: flippase [Candidatus Micrarchaeia archaeon]
MKQTNLIAKTSIWAFSSQILTKFISFLYLIILARLLTPEQIGAFYLVLAILGILYIFTDLGLIYSLGRYVPYLYGRKEFAKLKNLVKLSYLGGGVLTLIFTIVVFLLAGNIADFLNEEKITPVLQLMAIWILIKEIDDVSRGILSGRKKIFECQIMDVIQNGVKIIITLIAFYLIGFNETALSIGFLISFILILPIGVYWAYKEVKQWPSEEKAFTLKENIDLGKEVINFGIIITLISLLWTIIQYTDKIMISYLMPDSLAQIAVYTIALGLANLILIFPSAIGAVFFPLVSEYFGKNEMEKIRETINISIKWSIVTIIPIVAIMILFSQNLLSIFYGSNYTSGYIVLILFTAGLLIRSIFAILSTTLAAMRKLDVEIKSAGAAAISNIIFNIIFIPVWGINGAAFASLLSFIIFSLMIWYYSRKIFGFRFPKEIYKPIIAGIIGFLILFLIKDYIIIGLNEYIPLIQLGASQGQMADEIAQKMVKLSVFGVLFGLSCVIYFFSLLILRAFGEDEIEVLEAGLRKIKVPEKYIKLARGILEAKYLGNH